MSRSTVNSRKPLILVVVLLLTASQLPMRWLRPVSDPPRHIVDAAIAPLSGLLRRVSHHVRKPPNHDPDLGQGPRLRENYEQALQYCRQLEDQLAEARRKIGQLSQARAALSLTGIELLPGSVTAWSGGSGGSDNPTLTINRGERAGLRPGYVVANGFSLVGRVTDVSPLAARVRLITASNTLLAVRVIPPTPDAPERETLALLKPIKGGEGFVATTDVSDPVRVGDLAHLSDNSWPEHARGLVVGKVTAIERDPDDPELRRRVTVKPVRPLAYLDRVVVLVPTDGEGLP